MAQPYKHNKQEQRIRGRKLQQRRLNVWASSPQCAMCQRLTQYPDGFELDHFIPIHKHGEDTEDNCQVLCHECHKAKTAKDMGHAERPKIGADGWPIVPTIAPFRGKQG